MLNSLVLLMLISWWESYLQNDFGARTVGSGGTSVSETNGLESIHWNPGGLTQMDSPVISVECQFTDGEMYWSGITCSDSQRVLFETTEFLPSFVGVGLPIRKNRFLCISLSIPYKKRETGGWSEETTTEEPSGTGRYFRGVVTKRFYALNTALAWMWGRKLSVGVNLAWLLERHRVSIQYRGSDTDNCDYLLSKQIGIEPGIGLQYKVDKSLTVGAVLKKGLVSAHCKEETLPLLGSLGFGCRLHRQLFLSFSSEFINWSGVTHRFDGTLDAPDYLRNVSRSHLGIEYKLSSVALRIGCYGDPYPSDVRAKDQVFLTGGIGFEIASVRLDFAVASSRLIKSGEREEDIFLLSLTYEKP
jgi:long-subunit fatty acid transport protein